MHTRTGHNQVADTAEARERLGARTQLDAQPGNFGDTAGHQRRFGVVPEPQPVADARGQRDDVFQRTAQLHAGPVVVFIDAQRRVHHNLLHIGHAFPMPGGHNHRRRHAARHLFGMRGTGERRNHRFGQLLLDHLGQSAQRPLFQTLRNVDNDFAVRQPAL